MRVFVRFKSPVFDSYWHLQQFSLLRVSEAIHTVEHCLGAALLVFAVLSFFFVSLLLRDNYLQTSRFASGASVGRDDNVNNKSASDDARDDDNGCTLSTKKWRLTG